jgi:hypothetical protein
MLSPLVFLGQRNEPADQSLAAPGVFSNLGGCRHFYQIFNFSHSETKIYLKQSLDFCRLLWTEDAVRPFQSRRKWPKAGIARLLQEGFPSLGASKGNGRFWSEGQNYVDCVLRRCRSSTRQSLIWILSFVPTASRDLNDRDGCERYALLRAAGNRVQ